MAPLELASQLYAYSRLPHSGEGAERKATIEHALAQASLAPRWHEERGQWALALLRGGDPNPGSTAARLLRDVSHPPDPRVPAAQGSDPWAAFSLAVLGFEVSWDTRGRSYVLVLRSMDAPLDFPATAPFLFPFLPPEVNEWLDSGKNAVPLVLYKVGMALEDGREGFCSLPVVPVAYRREYLKGAARQALWPDATCPGGDCTMGIFVWTRYADALAFVARRIQDSLVFWEWGDQEQQPLRRELPAAVLQRSLVIWRGTSTRVAIPSSIPRLDSERTRVSDRWPRFWRQYWDRGAPFRRNIDWPQQLLKGNTFGDSIVCDQFTPTGCLKRAGAVEMSVP